MKRDGVYRFNLQFPADTQEHIRVGEVLERLGKRKSSLVVAALGEYLDRHPQWETPEVRIKIEQQSALTREKLEELVRRLVEETKEAPPMAELRGSELSMPSLRTGVMEPEEAVSRPEMVFSTGVSTSI